MIGSLPSWVRLGFGARAQEKTLPRKETGLRGIGCAPEKHAGPEAQNVIE